LSSRTGSQRHAVRSTDMAIPWRGQRRHPQAGIKATHKVGGLEPSVGGHVLASSGRHELTVIVVLRERGTRQNCAVFIRSGTGIKRAGASPKRKGETVRQDGKYVQTGKPISGEFACETDMWRVQGRKDSHVRVGRMGATKRCASVSMTEMPSSEDVCGTVRTDDEICDEY